MEMRRIDPVEAIVGDEFIDRIDCHIMDGARDIGNAPPRAPTVSNLERASRRGCTPHSRLPGPGKALLTLP